MRITVHTMTVSGIVFMIALASFSLAFAQGTTTPQTAASSTPQETPTPAQITSTPPSPLVSTPNMMPGAKPLSSEAQIRITNLAANISNRSEAYIFRLESIVNRMDSRIAKMRQEGYNMDDAQFYTTEARAAIAQAEEELALIDVRVLQFVTSEDYPTQWVAIRQTFTQTRAHLVRAQSVLQTALAEIKLTQDEGIPPATPVEDIEEETQATTTDPA